MTQFTDKAPGLVDALIAAVVAADLHGTHASREALRQHLERGASDLEAALQDRVALAAENERLRGDVATLTGHLSFIERWANHHARKPTTTPQQALSLIQHYPPIKAITKSYVDGVVPDTYDPYAVIEQQRKLLERAYGILARHETNGTCDLVCDIGIHLRQQDGEKK